MHANLKMGETDKHDHYLYNFSLFHTIPLIFSVDDFPIGLVDVLVGLRIFSSILSHRSSMICQESGLPGGCLLLGVPWQG